MTILHVHELSKRFHIHQIEREVAAFDWVSFTLHAGEFLLVRGPNGVGKSTLLRCLYRAYVPSAGQAMFTSTAGAIDLARAADVDIMWLRRSEIGNVSQFLRPRPRVSALDLVAEPLLLLGHDWETAQREAREWLAAFGLKPEIWSAYPATFSGGEQQKVNLARALIAPRRLLLLDEPTASLDAEARAALVERLGQLKARGVAMIGVFHHPEDVRGLIDNELYLAPPDSGSRRNGEEYANVAE